MKPFDKYDLYFGGKQNGFYSFDYHLECDFFALFPDSPVQDGNLAVSLQMEKKTNLLVLDFSITGTLTTTCDRCLDTLLLPVNLTFKQYVKLSEKHEELDAVTVSIPRTEDKINTAQWMYESVVLSIPIKKVHPLDENGHPTCNPEMLKKIKQLSNNNQIEKDPRWDKLTALLN